MIVEGLEGEFSGGCGGSCQLRMKCKRVGCEPVARRYRGGCDAMDRDCGGRAAEDVPPLLCHGLFTLKRELVGAEGCLSRGPRLVGAGEAVRARALFQEAPRGDERDGADCGKPLVVNGDFLPDRLLLRVLETFNVFGDARVVGTPAERGR